MKELETSVLYNGKMGSTKDCMRISLGRLERDKVAMHKPSFSLVDGIILEITQKEISRVKQFKWTREESYIEKNKKTYDF